ncbi:hypothetical protein EMGBS7_06860 [Candidatus Planktophila sp.]|nr:hypothetical protein EMGBS7_06860 [Candidatus Planktophila sp.]
MPKVIGFKTTDVRFPTSRGLDGSDAMNPRSRLLSCLFRTKNR